MDHAWHWFLLILLLLYGLRGKFLYPGSLKHYRRPFLTVSIAILVGFSWLHLLSCNGMLHANDHLAASSHYPCCAVQLPALGASVTFQPVKTAYLMLEPPILPLVKVSFNKKIDNKSPPDLG